LSAAHLFPCVTEGDLRPGEIVFRIRSLDLYSLDLDPDILLNRRIQYGFNPDPDPDQNLLWQNLYLKNGKLGEKKIWSKTVIYRISS
jgi:hypothetical protein